MHASKPRCLPPKVPVCKFSKPHLPSRLGGSGFQVCHLCVIDCTSSRSAFEQAKMCPAKLQVCKYSAPQLVLDMTEELIQACLHACTAPDLVFHTLGKGQAQTLRMELAIPSWKTRWWMTGMSISCSCNRSKNRRDACTLLTPSAVLRRAITASEPCRAAHVSWADTIIDISVYIARQLGVTWRHYQLRPTYIARQLGSTSEALSAETQGDVS